MLRALHYTALLARFLVDYTPSIRESAEVVFYFLLLEMLVDLKVQRSSLLTDCLREEITHWCF